jgi:hypothetical protein
MRPEVEIGMGRINLVNKSGNREMKLSYKTCERDGLKDRMELMI